MYNIQHCFICRPSDSTVSEDAGIEPRAVATTALAVGRSNYNHSARYHPHKIIQPSSRLYKQSGICFFIVFTTLFTVIQHYFKYPGFYVLLTVYSCNCEERSYLMDENVSSLIDYVCRGDRNNNLIL